MKYTLIIILAAFAIACQPDATTLEALEKANTGLNEKMAIIEQLKAEVDSLKTPALGLLMHQVYFDVKPGMEDQLITSIKSLNDIPFLLDVQVGKLKDLNDPRAMSNYEVSMTVVLANEADYQAYQKHPIHLKLKEVAANILLGPPTTYDFILE